MPAEWKKSKSSTALHARSMACHGAGITWTRAEEQSDSSLRDEAADVRFRHERGGNRIARARHLGVESTWVANRRAPRHPATAWWRTGMPGGLPRQPCRAVAPGHQPRSASRSLPDVRACRPLVRYESIRRGTLRILRRYCSDRTELARRSLKFDPYPAKLLAMQRAAP